MATTAFRGSFEEQTMQKGLINVALSRWVFSVGGTPPFKFDVALCAVLFFSALALSFAAILRAVRASSKHNLIAPLGCDPDGLPSKKVCQPGAGPYLGKKKKAQRQRERARQFVGGALDVVASPLQSDIERTGVDSLPTLIYDAGSQVAPAALEPNVDEVVSCVSRAHSQETPVDVATSSAVAGTQEIQLPVDTDACQSSFYHRGLLLAHRQISLRIARGPPGLELPEGVVVCPSLALTLVKYGVPAAV